jgi:hypothetical protein
MMYTLYVTYNDDVKNFTANDFTNKVYSFYNKDLAEDIYKDCLARNYVEYAQLVENKE